MFLFLYLQEAKVLLSGEKLGDTRQETQKKGAKPTAPKRSLTIQKTLEEGVNTIFVIL